MMSVVRGVTWGLRPSPRQTPKSCEQAITPVPKETRALSSSPRLSPEKAGNQCWMRGRQNASDALSFRPLRDSEQILHHTCVLLRFENLREL